MLKLSIREGSHLDIDEIHHLSTRAIKSKAFYQGFNQWFDQTFIPGINKGERTILSVRDKRYDTLTGFALLKHTQDEYKLCNLSPLLDGVGITQVLLDVSLFYFDKDFLIDVPIQLETKQLHSKLRTLGFEIINSNHSTDATSQLTYIKPVNVSWI